MRRLTLVILLALIVSVPASAQTLRVTAERTNLRDQPSTSGAVVAAVARGDELEVLERAGSWYRVRVRSTGREGYVSSLLVEMVGGAAAAPAPAPSAAPAPPPAAEPAAPAPAAPAPAPTSDMTDLSQASASASSGSGFQIGIKGGWQMATIDIQALGEDEPQESKGGPIAGVSFRIPIGNLLALQPELLLSSKGSSDPGDGEDSITIRYLEVPVLATLRFGAGASVSPFVSVGPALALKISAEADGQDEAGVDVDEFVKSNDVGLVVAGGVDFGRLSVEARYTHGLTNIFDVEGIGEVPDDLDITFKNRAFSILVGFRF